VAEVLLGRWDLLLRLDRDRSRDNERQDETKNHVLPLHITSGTFTFGVGTA
jgi:hypothetical protein